MALHLASPWNKAWGNSEIADVLILLSDHYYIEFWVVLYERFDCNTWRLLQKHIYFSLATWH